MDPDWSADLALAHELADTADRITVTRFLARDLRVHTKPDATEVTDADIAVEQAVASRLRAARPDDALLGEETGSSGPASTRRWILDPIDGTRSYLRGVPIWATLLALEVDGDVTLGVVSAPALHRRWWAARGLGAWAGSRRCTVSQVSRLADASLSYSSLRGWERSSGGNAMVELAGRCWRSRAYGDFFSHVLVAEGAVDLSAEPDVSYWDLAATQVIVEEAGGVFTGLDGVRGARQGSVLASNGTLHREALAILAAGPLGPERTPGPRRPGA